MLNYRVTFPPVTASDTTYREVTSRIGDADPVVISYPAAQATFDLSAPDNAVVALTLVDIDDAGNRSDASDPLTFTATDTLPPPKPGLMSVALVGES